jgi:glycosyltransferase involved in cell wall biosynthesis
VFLYIGRLNKEKGIKELLSTFNISLDKCVDMHLLIVGPDEEGFDLKINSLANKYPTRVHRISLTPTPEKYMAASDVLVLPSYREGFGNVVIEAASVGLPAIVSNVYGLADSISDGGTGFLHNIGAVHEIVFFVNLLYKDHNLRLKMSLAAHNRATKYFSQEILTFEFQQFYKKINVY